MGGGGGTPRGESESKSANVEHGERSGIGGVERRVRAEGGIKVVTATERHAERGTKKRGSRPRCSAEEGAGRRCGPTV